MYVRLYSITDDLPAVKRTKLEVFSGGENTEKTGPNSPVQHHSSTLRSALKPILERFYFGNLKTMEAFILPHLWRANGFFNLLDPASFRLPFYYWGSLFSAPHLDISSSIGSSVFPFSVSEYSTLGGI
jgi:hypothetical protein